MTDHNASKDPLDDYSVDELFSVLESMGINLGELRKARHLMREDRLRQNLYMLLENHVRHRGYKDFQRTNAE